MLKSDYGQCKKRQCKRKSEVGLVLAKVVVSDGDSERLCIRGETEHAKARP